MKFGVEDFWEYDSRIFNFVENWTECHVCVCVCVCVLPLCLLTLPLLPLIATSIDNNRYLPVLFLRAGYLVHDYGKYKRVTIILNIYWLYLGIINLYVARL